MKHGTLLAFWKERRKHLRKYSGSYRHLTTKKKKEKKMKIFKITNMATGDNVILNADYIVSLIPFELDGKKHCFVNMLNGKQYKCVEPYATIMGRIDRALAIGGSTFTVKSSDSGTAIGIVEGNMRIDRDGPTVTNIKSVDTLYC